MKNTRVRTFYKPERKAEVIDELNGDSKPRSILFVLIGMVTGTIALVSIKIHEEWLDANGHIILSVILIIGLGRFAYWALVGRKK